jgi:hypothetical protein
VDDRLTIRVTLPGDQRPLLRPLLISQELLVPITFDGNKAKLGVDYRW